MLATVFFAEMREGGALLLAGRKVFEPQRAYILLGYILIWQVEKMVAFLDEFATKGANLLA